MPRPFTRRFAAIRLLVCSLALAGPPADAVAEDDGSGGITIGQVATQTLDQQSSPLLVPVDVGRPSRNHSHPVLAVEAVNPPDLVSVTVIPPAAFDANALVTRWNLSLGWLPGPGGTATVSLVATDDRGRAARTSFDVVVLSNAPPVISAIPPQTTKEDVPLPGVAFTVEDPDGDTAAVVVTATSSNPQLVPDANLTISGAGASRSLQIVPTADESGTTTITVTARDASGSVASRSFLLTVTPVDDPPRIGDVADQVTLQGQAVGPINFTVDDVDTPAASLVVTATTSNPLVVPASGIALGGGGNTRTVTVTPSATSTGTAVITLRVSDGTSSATDSFTVTVTALPCTFTVSGTPPVLPAAGGSASVVVGASAASCQWTAASQAAWLTVSPASGFGPGGVIVTAAPNPGTAARSTTLTVAGHDLLVSQAGSAPTCSIAFGPSPASVPAEGGAVSFTVTPIGTGCADWSATTSTPWLAITAGASGSGPGSVTATAAQNTTGQARQGSVVLQAGALSATAVVTQSALTACQYAVTPERVAFSTAGGTRIVAVQAPGGCQWSVAVAPEAGWLALTSAGGFGNGGVAIAAGANTGAPREATLVVSDAGQRVVGSVIVAQDGLAGGDADGDGLDSEWEIRFGLDATSGDGENGPLGDPDGDGLTNLQERRNCDEPGIGCTHPRGFTEYSRYLAEGATGDFFATRFALLNPGPLAARALLRFQPREGPTVTHAVQLPPHSRRTLEAGDLTGLAQAEFATTLESDVEVVIDRTMTWDRGVYGSHAETGRVEPRAVWYFAEGATFGDFDLFYLLQNPGATPAEVEVRFLLPHGPPVLRTYTIEPGRRFNVWVDLIPELAAAEVSAVIRSTNGVPILAERAMYSSRAGRPFLAGHASAAVPAPSTSWFLAEGATGPYFDLFVLVANPNDTAAQVEARFLLSNGSVVTRAYTVGPNARFNIWVDHVDPRLADAEVSTTIRSTNGVPLIVERAMWWPGSGWHEAHNSAGATSTGTLWALAEGEQGGPRSTETYVLIANTSTSPGTAAVTLVFEDGATVRREFPLLATSRRNVAIGVEFPEAHGRRFGALVESLGASPAQIVVERAMYSDADGVTWAAGTNALGTRLK